MKINSVCLIRLPSEDALFGAMGIKMPPFSLGVITGYLREQGINVDQYDLLPRMEEIYSLVNDWSAFEAFFDKEAVFSYCSGGTNIFFDQFVESLLREIPIDQYDMLAFSIGPDQSWVQTHSGLIFGEYIKRRLNKIMVFGGINLNTMINFRPVYDELLVLMIRKFSYIIGGPGEEPLYRLIRALREDQSEAEIRQIKGMCYLDANGQLVVNPWEKQRIVKPDFTGFRLEDYYNCLKKDGHRENMIIIYRYPFLFTKKLHNPNTKSDEYEKRLVIPYIFNYNCPYKCAFCTNSNPDAPAPVIGKVEQIIKELEEMKATYDTPYFYFINNAVNLSKKFITSFCREIIDRNLEIYWSDCARFDNVDYEILQMMKQAGCQKLVFGMETGSPALLKRINKEIDLDYAEQVLSWCQEIGIWAELEIIAGMPTEQEEDFQESLKYLERIVKYVSFMTVNHYILIPGSVMFRYPDQFHIEIGERATYEDILARDLALFKQGKNPIAANNINKVYRYRDRERDFHQVTSDTVERVYKIKKLLENQLMKETLKYVQQGILKLNDLRGPSTCPLNERLMVF